MKATELNQSQRFILWWNTTFPFDLVWRKKYGVRFLSEEHRNTSLYSIFLDVYEEVYLKDLFEKEKKREEDALIYEATGEFLKKDSKFSEMDSEEIDNFIQNFDLDAFNDTKDQTIINLSGQQDV